MRHLNILIFCLTSKLFLSQNTVGLISYESGIQDGYTLFAPLGSTKTFLIDKCGEKVREWNSTYKPGQAVYLLNDGSLLRAGNTNNITFNAGGTGGIIEKFDWEGNLTWSYTLSNDSLCQHHDFHPMENGNILVIAWQKKSFNEAILMGKNPASTNEFVWSEKILEIEPLANNQYNIVWEWNLWDHLIQDFDSEKVNYGVVENHPELIDINYVSGPPTSQDWIHLNSIDYNESLDQILLSSHNFDEIWIIDHSSNSTLTATHSGGNSGKGGDLLYRWGNPLTYKRGTIANQKLFGQHHATWIPSGYPQAGKILYFNNGNGRPEGAFSSVEYLNPPINGSNYNLNGNNSFEPFNSDFIYTDNPTSNFYASNISGVYPLENGNFLITNGPKGTLFEINPSSEIQWKYINPVSTTQILTQGVNPIQNMVFRANFYPVDFIGFQNKELVPYGEIEINPNPISLCITNEKAELNLNKFEIYPNPTIDKINLNSLNTENKIQIFNESGILIKEIDSNTTDLNGIDLSDLPKGLYFVRYNNVFSKFIKQ